MPQCIYETLTIRLNFSPSTVLVFMRSLVHSIYGWIFSVLFMWELFFLVFLPLYCLLVSIVPAIEFECILITFASSCVDANLFPLLFVLLHSLCCVALVLHVSAGHYGWCSVSCLLFTKSYLTGLLLLLYFLGYYGCVGWLLAVWLRRLLADFGQEKEGATEIFCDNKAAIAMSENLAFDCRTKHIDIRVHFIRDLVASSQIQMCIAAQMSRWLMSSQSHSLMKSMPILDQSQFWRGSVENVVQNWIYFDWVHIAVVLVRRVPLF